MVCLCACRCNQSKGERFFAFRKKNVVVSCAASTLFPLIIVLSRFLNLPAASERQIQLPSCFSSSLLLLPLLLLPLLLLPLLHSPLRVENGKEG